MKFFENGDGITEPRGFFGSGVHCDVKGTRDGKLDLGIIYSKRACSAAGVFTTNDVAAAPVTYCQGILAEKEQLFMGLSQIAGMPMHALVLKGRPTLKKWPPKLPVISEFIPKRFLFSPREELGSFSL